MSEPRHEEHQVAHEPPPPPPSIGTDNTEEVPLPSSVDEDAPPTEEEVADLAKSITVDAEVVPPPPLELHRCHRKHEQLGACESVATSTATGQVIARSGEVCQVCFLQWLGATFPTQRVLQTS